MQRLCGSLETMLPSETRLLLCERQRCEENSRRSSRAMSHGLTLVHISRCPFDSRDVWDKAKGAAKVTINGDTWRSTVGNRGRSTGTESSMARRGVAQR